MFNKLKIALGLDPIQKKLNEYGEIVEKINALESSFEPLSDDALSAKTTEFKERLQRGETLDDLLPEAFAVVREASKRVLGQRHYDVQLIGGMALHHHNIAEMKTGEGKTLVATLPVYLNALAGNGVHVITVNDYLARRDARWMGPIYQLLGLSIGVLQMAARTDNGKKAFLVDLSVSSPHEDQNQMRLIPRKEAYEADITYGTNSEFGFDYLRDNMTMSLEDRVQRGHPFAIIDEVDNVLIDEARTPLIISGPASDDVEAYYTMAKVVKQLSPEDYEVSEKDRNVYLNDNGMDHVEELLGMVLRDPSRPEEVTTEQERMMGYLNQALSAEFLYHRNKEYLVQSGKVVIVDSFTGRLMPGRRWSNGLHQAIEAKEGVKVEPENMTYATITLQNYYRMYGKIAGMTGTALTEKEEFYKIYLLDVIPIPTNLEYTARQKGSSLIERSAKDESGYKYVYYAEPTSPDVPKYFRRKDFPDIIYQTEEAKFRAITVEILRNYVVGRPQLIGTASVEHSEFLASRLRQEPLRRLVQVLMLRRAWMVQNNIEYLESPIKEFIPFNKPVQELSAGELRPMAKQLNVSLNVDDPDNIPLLMAEFELEESDMERFLKTVESGINPQVLNARKHDEEGMIIAHAGAFGAVTIATNMAGRGVDIKLGGELDEEHIRNTNRVLTKADIDPYNMTLEERYQALRTVPAEEHGIYEESVQAYLNFIDQMNKVRELGGLHVVGSERHESRRIDNQLRGRAARQGDPGSSRFFLSLQDEIVRLFGGQQLEGVLNRVNLLDQNVPLENNLFSRMIEQAQERVEGANFDVRKHTLEYDDVLNSQRKRIYDQRDQAFVKEDLSEDVETMLETDLENRLDKDLGDERWKLAAYLDSIQPAIELEDDFLPTFSQTLLIKDLQKKTGVALDKNTIIDALETLSRAAFKAEVEAGLIQLTALAENTRTNYENQLEERNNNFELFVESLEEKLKDQREARDDGRVVESLRPQDLLTEAGNIARVGFRLSNEKQRQLVEGSEEVIEELRDQIGSALFRVFIQRLNQLISNRFSGDLQIPAMDLGTGDWETYEDEILGVVQVAYDAREERLFGTGRQIRSDLEAALRTYQPAALSAKQWVQLFNAVSQGQRVAFDARTHRRVNRAYTRINFVYYCGKLLESLSREEVRDKIWDHYHTAMEGLKTVFGNIDWNRLRSYNILLEQLYPETQQQMADLLGAEVFERIRVLPPAEIEESIVAELKPFLGARIQNEVNRQVILRSITNQWVDYLTQIEGLRVSISMESYAQRNPLVVYKMKAGELFSQLLNDIRRSVVERMFVTLPQLNMLTAAERMSLTEIRQREQENTPAAAEPAQSVPEIQETPLAKEESTVALPPQAIPEKQPAAIAEEAISAKSRKKKKKMKR